MRAAFRASARKVMKAGHTRHSRGEVQPRASPSGNDGNKAAKVTIWNPSGTIAPSHPASTSAAAGAAKSTAKRH